VKWEPTKYPKDTVVNAILNVACAIDRNAKATEDLLYALKYSKAEGLSIAEAIEVAAKDQSVNVNCGFDTASTSSIESIGADIGSALKEGLEALGESIYNGLVDSAGRIAHAVEKILKKDG